MAETAKTEMKNQAAKSAAARTMTHDGFLVVSPIRYLNVQGNEISAGVGEIVRDITEDARAMFEAKQLIKPNFVTAEK